MDFIKKIFFILIGISVLAFVAWIVTTPSLFKKSSDSVKNATTDGKPLSSYFTMPTIDTSTTNTGVKNTSQTQTDTQPTPISDLIQVTTPYENSFVRAGTEVQGKAVGNWFFEGTSLVRVVDASGKDIGAFQIKAVGSWQTSDMVPFTGIVIMHQPQTKAGFLNFEKANPSGLKKNEKSFVLPVTFIDPNQSGVSTVNTTPSDTQATQTVSQ